MKYISLLPADLYTVINKTLLTEYDKKNLISLYEPIIGALPVSLYLSLWSDLDKSETAHFLCVLAPLSRISDL